MTRYARQCRLYLTISAWMFAGGLALPLILGLTAPSLHVSPFVWNFLQIGGLLGCITFWLMAKLAGNPKAEPAPAT